jgi:hypothetical protein
MAKLKAPVINEISIGADPEVFAIGMHTLAPTPVCGLLGGTKKKPQKFPDNMIAYYLEDNVAAELNIAPGHNAGSFKTHMTSAMISLEKRLKEIGMTVLRSKCCVLFPKTSLTHPGAREFGCDPDYDGYLDGKVVPKIDRQELVASDALGEGEWRFAGGHVHLGYKAPDVPHYIAANFADLFLGLPSIGEDVQGIRRKYYGTASRYRPKPYGIEYRSLSNYWLWGPYLGSVANRSERLARWLSSTDTTKLQNVYAQIPWMDVRDAINTENQDLSYQVTEFVAKIIPEIQPPAAKYGLG